MGRKITKTEKQGIFFIIIGVMVFAFLTDPITGWVSDTFPNSMTRFLIGLGLIFAVAYFGRLSTIK